MEEARLLTLLDSTSQAFDQLETQCLQHKYCFVETALRAIRLVAPSFRRREEEPAHGGHGAVAVGQAQPDIDLCVRDLDQEQVQVQQRGLEASQADGTMVLEVKNSMPESPGLRVRLMEMEKIGKEGQDEAVEEEGNGVAAWLGELRGVEDSSCFPPGALGEGESCEVGLVVKAPTCMYMVEGRMVRMASRESAGMVKFEVERFSKQAYVTHDGVNRGAAWHDIVESANADSGRLEVVQDFERLEGASHAVVAQEDVTEPLEDTNSEVGEEVTSQSPRGATNPRESGRLKTSMDWQVVEYEERVPNNPRQSGGSMDWQAELEDRDGVQDDVEIEMLPKEVNHPHPSLLIGSPCANKLYKCDACGNGGQTWAYRCDACGSDVHLECAASSSTEENLPEDGNNSRGQEDEVDQNTGVFICDEDENMGIFICDEDGREPDGDRHTYVTDFERPCDEKEVFVCDEDGKEPDRDGHMDVTDDERPCEEKEADYSTAGDVGDMYLLQDDKRKESFNCRGVSSLPYSGASEKMSFLGPTDMGISMSVSVQEPASENTSPQGEEAETNDVPKPKRPNVIERGNIRSFLPLLKQQPAPPPARPVKVWALEAAHVARRQEEQKALERKMRKEHQKLLKDQQKEERAKQLREEERQVKDRKREQRLDLEKLPEQSRSLQDSDVGSKSFAKLSVTSSRTAADCTLKRKQFTSTGSTKLVLADCSNTCSNTQSKANRVLEAKHRIDLEKAKKLEEDRKRKEDEWRRKGPQLAAKKQGRHETEKNHRHEKRKRQEEAMVPYQDHVEKQMQAELKDQEKTVTSKYDGLRPLAGSDERQLQGGLKDQEKQSTAEHASDSRQQEAVLRDQEMRCTPDQLSRRVLADLDLGGPQSYEISPYRGSSDDDEDDDSVPQKPIPLWARSENLLPQLIKQRHIDPDEIFTNAKTCSLKEVFETKGSKKKSDWGKRSFSGNWLEDRVSWKEELQYKEMMGYAISVQTIPEHRL